MTAIGNTLRRFLDIEMTQAIIHNLKAMAAAYYDKTRANIVERLAQGSMLQVDETRVSVKGKTGYVWVLSNLHEVAFVYAETREGDFIRALLREFRGVLVSDFYAAYDSLNCPQQKCLLHLIRDLNTEILDQPYDEDLKSIVEAFAAETRHRNGRPVWAETVPFAQTHGIGRMFLSSA